MSKQYHKLVRDKIPQIIAATGKTCRTEILEETGRVVLTQRNAATAVPYSLNYPSAKPWNLDSPTRYICRVSLLDDEGTVLDVMEDKFGFRTAEFRTNEFLLNGRKVFLRGLNRHQCYPYIGYAATESLQREDARILKEELGCVIVRTSHYPQSQYFIDECDRLGLLVFTEIPGWQHIGDDNWKEQVVENTKEMVLQYRNHPSIILWGVRINESADDDEFYSRTNALAHKLDPTRQTGGVRCISVPMDHEGVLPAALENAQVLDSTKVTLREIFVSRKQIVYEYDFGDGWMHTIELCRVIGDCTEPYPHCIMAIGDAPMEDCGGPDGFRQVLAVLKDKKHPEHQETLEWIRFDLVATVGCGADQYDDTEYPSENDVSLAWITYAARRDPVGL